MTDPLGRLSALNDEEWAGKPYMIELRGGFADGRRFVLRDLPWIWRIPEPLGMTDLLSKPDPLVAVEPMLRTVDYRRTDQVTDEGTHIYEVNGLK